MCPEAPAQRSITRSDYRTVPISSGPDTTPAVQHAATSSLLETLEFQRATLAAHRTHLTRSDALPAPPPSSASHSSQAVSFYAALDVVRLTAQRVAAEDAALLHRNGGANPRS